MHHVLDSLTASCACASRLDLPFVGLFVGLAPLVCVLNPLPFRLRILPYDALCHFLDRTNTLLGEIPSRSAADTVPLAHLPSFYMEALHPLSGGVASCGARTAVPSIVVRAEFNLLWGPEFDCGIDCWGWGVLYAL